MRDGRDVAIAGKCPREHCKGTVTQDWDGEYRCTQCSRRYSVVRRIITPEMRNEIRVLDAKGLRADDIAAELGLNRNTISKPLAAIRRERRMAEQEKEQEKAEQPETGWKDVKTGTIAVAMEGDAVQALDDDFTITLTGQQAFDVFGILAKANDAAREELREAERRQKVAQVASDIAANAYKNMWRKIQEAQKDESE